MAVIPEEIINPKPTSSRLVLRASLLSLVAFLTLSAVAPFVNSARIRRALEAELGHPVTFEKVYDRLLPVTCLEPFTDMHGHDARLRIDKLLLGQIRLGSAPRRTP